MGKCLNKSQQKTLKCPLYVMENLKSKDRDDSSFKELNLLSFGFHNVASQLIFVATSHRPRSFLDTVNTIKIRSLLLQNSYSIGGKDKK